MSHWFSLPLLLTTLIALPAHSTPSQQAESSPLTLRPSSNNDELQADAAHLRRRGMQVLGGWALTNIAVGGVGLATASSPQWRGFHEGNLSWNVINLGLAGVALLTQASPSSDPLTQLNEGSHLRRILSFNAGLDVAYVVAGAWLWDQGQRLGDGRQRGWGQALVVQGLFLLAFDLSLSWLQGRHDQRLVRVLSGG